MPDTMTPAARSALMRRIRGVNTSPERHVFRILDAAGVEHRRHAKDLPGTPDVAIDRIKVAVFVHGCFWHGCPQHYRLPKTRSEFWAAKLARTRRRDMQAQRMLSLAGWGVVTIWEHEARNQRRVLEQIRSAARFPGRNPNPGRGRPARHLQRLKNL